LSKSFWRELKDSSQPPEGGTTNNDHLERLKKNCSHSVRWERKAVFLVFGFRLRQGYGGQVVSAQSRVYQTCFFAEASPKTKNPRSELATVFP
jgi:hypothetical protein